MGYEHVKTRYTRAQVKAIIKNGINACNGRGPDTYGFYKALRGAMAYSLFTSIYEAFLLKSAHQTDELGFSWVDLTPEYKTYSRMDARLGIPLPGPKYRPTLTTIQDNAWRGVYARLAFKRGRKLTSKKERAKLKRKDLDELRGKRRVESQNSAAASAWSFVKEHLNAHPLIELVPPRKVPLLVRTGKLRDSLKPAPLLENGDYKPIDHNQVFRLRQNELTLGSKLFYAGYVDKLRPLWPRDMRIWMDRAVKAGRDAASRRLLEILQG